MLIAMYSNLCLYVIIANQKCTSHFKCNVGTRQVCKLSPLLFIFFINDLKHELNNSGIKGIQISSMILMFLHLYMQMIWPIEEIQ